MKTLKFFKITESQKKFDIVELLYDELEYEFVVKWKWTTMREPSQKKYKIYAEAKEKYNERKHFAKICN